MLMHLSHGLSFLALFESLFNSGTTPGYWAWHVYRETYLCDIRFI